jgi:hypothetical protein
MKPKKLADGSLVYKYTSKKLLIPDGFKQHPKNSLHLIPDLPCLYQEERPSAICCNKTYPILHCKLKNTIINEEICLTCPDCPL